MLLAELHPGWSDEGTSRDLHSPLGASRRHHDDRGTSDEHHETEWSQMETPVPPGMKDAFLAQRLSGVQSSPLAPTRVASAPLPQLGEILPRVIQPEEGYLELGPVEPRSGGLRRDGHRGHRRIRKGRPPLRRSELRERGTIVDEGREEEPGSSHRRDQTVLADMAVAGQHAEEERRRSE